MMTHMNDQQRNRAVEVMQEYSSAPAGPDGRTPVETSATLDARRVEVIEEHLNPLVSDYLGDRIPLANFKSTIDGINKRNEFWGFKGIKGQMFFNMVANAAGDPTECDQELKSALAVPANEQIAISRIRTFASYVKRVGDEWVEAGNTRHGAPKTGSIPFFLSYFWQIQGRDAWPVYYTNAVNTMVDLNLWQPSEDLAENYIRFKQLHEELAVLFTQAAGRRFGLYDVEHVFWFKGGNPYLAAKGEEDESPHVVVQPSRQPDPAAPLERLPESYTPPIVAILPSMARHEEALIEAAKRSGTTLERAFEKYLDAAFTVLGYETKLLGQGQGRVPDGLAITTDHSYAILWDAKIRASGYSIGTDDRAIREYITTQSRELKRRRSMRNIYYFVISSKFADDYDDTVRSIKMDTDVNEVILLEADALVAMVDARLRAPLQTSLGPDGLQRLFTNSGVVTGDDVRQFFM